MSQNFNPIINGIRVQILFSSTHCMREQKLIIRVLYCTFFLLEFIFITVFNSIFCVKSNTFILYNETLRRNFSLISNTHKL
jgi:TRAP-type mannitol/chloroaromatic compound transport system permease small subunit